MFREGVGRTVLYMLLFWVEEPTWWICCWTSELMGAVGTQRDRVLWICRHQTALWGLHCRKEVYYRQPDSHVACYTNPKEGIKTPSIISTPACPGPCSLSQLCRFCVRRSLGRSRLHRASSLFLPHSITDFLLYQWGAVPLCAAAFAVLHICALTSEKNHPHSTNGTPLYQPVGLITILFYLHMTQLWYFGCTRLKLHTSGSECNEVLHFYAFQCFPGNVCGFFTIPTWFLKETSW